MSIRYVVDTSILLHLIIIPSNETTILGLFVGIIIPVPCANLNAISQLNIC